MNQMSWNIVVERGVYTYIWGQREKGRGTSTLDQARMFKYGSIEYRWPSDRERPIKPIK